MIADVTAARSWPIYGHHGRQGQFGLTSWRLIEGRTPRAGAGALSPSFALMNGKR